MRGSLRVGIVGAGRIGIVHGQNLAFHFQNVEIKRIVDVNVQAAKALGQRLGVEKVGEHYDEVINDSEIDAVIICSSTDTHADITQAAAKKGKHIFCEKPIDLNLQRIHECIKTVSTAGVTLQVGFNRRFDPNFKRIADQVRTGTIGKPHLVRISSRDPEPPPASYVQRSGGLFLDMMIHDFDMARYVINEEVEEVYATGGCLVNPEIAKLGDIDTAVVTLRYKSGAMCTIDNSRKAVYGYDQRLEAFGSNGTLSADNNFGNNVTVWNKEGVRRDPPLWFFIERYQTSYLEMAAFIDAVSKGQKSPVDGIDGLRAVELGLAAMESLKTNTPVKVRDSLK